MNKKKRSIIVGTIVAITVALFLPGLSIADNADKTIISKQRSQTWDQTINNPSRFKLVMGGQGVLDKETGLVWEQSPTLENFTWEDAQFHCNTLIKGNRMGWRLPALQELESLVDPSVSFPGIALPNGSPFDIGGWVDFWSSTTYAAVTTSAWFVAFNGSGVIGPANKSVIVLGAWCVRGGQGVDPQ